MKTATLVGMLAVMGIGACGGGGSVPLDELAPRLVDAECGYFAECGVASSKETCVASVDVGPSFQQLKAGVAAGKIRYDGAAAQSCLDVFSKVTCSALSLGSTVESSCDPVFRGTLPSGGACLLDEECLSASCDKSGCASADACCAGTCAAGSGTKVAGGGACEPFGNQCVAGTFCRPAANGATGTCVSQIATGQPCSGRVPAECAGGLQCTTGVAVAGGVCLRLPLTGEACTPSAPCESLADWCSTTTNKCTKRTAVNAACTAEGECALYASCAIGTQTCVAKSTKGGPCTTSEDCQIFLKCTAGACASDVENGICPA